jgi:hypothetical protein
MVSAVAACGVLAEHNVQADHVPDPHLCDGCTSVATVTNSAGLNQVEYVELF